jgi:adenylate cyclase
LPQPASSSIGVLANFPSAQVISGKSACLAPLLAGFLIASVLSFIQSTPLGGEIEAQALDAFFLLRGARPAPPGIVIVAIDEPSIQELGLPWPWPRSLHAELLRKLDKAGVRLVVMDVVFAEKSNLTQDLSFEQALAESGRVILASTVDRVEDPVFSRIMLVEPLERFRQAALGTGSALFSPDPDGSIRRFSTRMAGVPTLAAAAFGTLHDAAPPDIDGGLLDHLGPPRTIRTVSYTQVLDEAHPLPALLLHNAVIFVGRSLAAPPELGEQADAFRTPFSRTSGIPTAGVELHATALAALQSGHIGVQAPAWASAAAAFALLPLGALLLSRLSPLSGALASLVGAGGILGGSYLLFSTTFTWFPPLLLASGLLSAEAVLLLEGYMRSARDKRRIRMAFSRYVSPDVVDMLLSRPDLLEPGGHEVDATVLFSDLAGFTSFSERMLPEDLMKVLSGYFAPMTAVIKENSGTLDKFIGDAIMAFWGAPLRDEHHAENACRAALAMGRAMDELRSRWQDQGYPLLHARIGIHSGKVVAGNVGSREQMNYTCLGDTVNLASRLESVNKYYGTGILLSGETRALLGPGFITRKVDAIKVKGRARPVEIHELLDLGDSPPPWAALHESGLAVYAARDFSGAAGMFASVLDMKPGDGPAALLLKRCRKLLESPPDAQWDAIHILESK